MLLNDAFENLDKTMNFHTFVLSKFKWECNALTEITRGSMGRRNSVGETMLGCFRQNICYSLAVTMQNNIVHMTSHHADNLKYGFTDASGLDKRKLVTTHGAASMEKAQLGDNKQ
jgi:hypothetical protein